MIKEKITEWNHKMSELPKKDRFKIMIEFQTPRAGNDIMMFDSVISYFTMKHVLGVEFHNLGREWIHIEIPVEKWNGPDPFYFITGIMDQPDIPTYWVKRYEKRELQIVKDKLVRTNTGKFRNYMQPLLTCTKKDYIIDGIGNYKLLETIIPKKTFLGKKTGSGYGQCIITVELIEGGRGDFLIRKGVLQRPLPCSYIPGDLQKAIFNEKPVKYPYYGEASNKCKIYEAGSCI